MEKLLFKSEIGNTGVFVPPIVFGTSALGNLYKVLDAQTKLAIIENWFRWVQPPVVIDTAGKYGAGLALEEIGNGLRKLGITPAEIIISNKLGWYRTELTAPEPSFEPGVWIDLQYDAVQKISYGGILDCYEQGLELLGGDYTTEILSVHDPDEYLRKAENEHEYRRRMNDILEAYEALLELKEKGHAQAIGIGAKNWKVIRNICDRVKLDWVMLATSFTIMEQPPELLEFMDELQGRKVSIINSAVFHGGFLTGSDYYNYQKLSREEESSRSLYRWRESFYTICSKHSVDPADASIQYGLSHPGIIGVALNSSRPEAIQRNIRQLSSQIPNKFWEELQTSGLANIPRDVPGGIKS